MGLPVVLPGLPLPDTNFDRRILLGDVDLSAPLITEYGVVRFTGQKLDGWSGGTGSTRSSVQRSGRPGAVSSKDPQSLPRLMTLAFTVRAESPAAMREAWDRLNVAASKDDFTLTRDQWGLRRHRTVYRQGDIAETLYPSALIKGWSCQLKADDPRMYGEPVTVSTGLPSTTGGLTFPTSSPLVFNAVTVTGVASIDNVGTEISAVRLRIDGPVPAPIVTHTGTGRQLVFSTSYTLPAGNWLDVDLDLHTVLENGVADRSMFVTGRGWFDAEPGDNDFRFAAAAYNAAAQLTVMTAPAWE